MATKETPYLVTKSTGPNEEIKTQEGKLNKELRRSKESSKPSTCIDRDFVGLFNPDIHFARHLANCSLARVGCRLDGLTENILERPYYGKNPSSRYLNLGPSRLPQVPRLFHS
jgi:hypothetical protein